MIFDLMISNEELEVLDSIKITTQNQYSRLGDLHLIKNELPEFLSKTTDANEKEIEIITNLVDRLSSNVVDSVSGESAWVALRTSVENSAFDLRRWHIDGPFFGLFETDPVFTAKFATTLKGDTTLFYPLPEDMRDNFCETQNDRPFWHAKLDDSLIIRAKIGQGAFFVVGDPERNAVHSEPKITQDRIFLSVVPGTQEQITELERVWVSVGNPKIKK